MFGLERDVGVDAGHGSTSIPTDRSETHSTCAQRGNQPRRGVHRLPLVLAGCRLVAIVHDDDVAGRNARRHPQRRVRRVQAAHGRGGLSAPSVRRRRLHASPVAADGKIYLASEDGEMLVVAAGPEFKHLATNSMGELLMATPALSEGVMYVRSSASLFAVGRKPGGR